MKSFVFIAVMIGVAGRGLVTAPAPAGLSLNFGPLLFNDEPAGDRVMIGVAGSGLGTAPAPAG